MIGIIARLHNVYKRYGVTVSELKEKNNANANRSVVAEFPANYTKWLAWKKGTVVPTAAEIQEIEAYLLKYDSPSDSLTDDVAVIELLERINQVFADNQVQTLEFENPSRSVVQDFPATHRAYRAWVRGEYKPQAAMRTRLEAWLARYEKSALPSALKLVERLTPDEALILINHITTLKNV